MPGKIAVAAVHEQVASEVPGKGSSEKLSSATLRGTVAAAVAHTPHKQAVVLEGKESSGQQCLVTMRCKAAESAVAAVAGHTTDKEVAVQ